jgi:DNA-binding transcriptional LysR family regulator
MKLKHLEIFHAVMLTGSLSAAARLLHLTQPAATQALQAAERQLGYALFLRQKNRLVPSAEAEMLMPEVSALMAQLDSVRRLAVAQRDGHSAPLRVLVVPSLAVVQLPEALRHFRRRHAAARLAIRTLHTQQIVQALLLREADVGIVYGSSAPPGLVAETLASGQLVSVSRQRIGRAATVSLAELSRHPLIRLDGRDPLGALLADEATAESRAGEIVVQTHHLALVLAEQGFGVAVVDSFTAAAAARQAGLHVQPLEPELRVGVQALLAPGSRSGRLASAFVAAFSAAVQPPAQP